MKKFISAITCICLIANVLFGVSLVSYAKGVKTEYDVNPLYKGVSTCDEPSGTMPPYQLYGANTGNDNKVVFTDYKSAAMYVRDLMVNREKSFSIRISKNAKDNLENVYRVDSSSCYYVIYAAFSFEIAKGSTDGDYLSSAYAGASCTTYYSNDFNEYEYTVKYRTTAKEEAAVADFVDSVVNKLNSRGLTRLQLIKAVHDTVCATTQYDWNSYNNGYSLYSNINTAYSAVATGYTLCEGYSALFYRICRKLGIPVRTVVSETHAWNIVKPAVGKYYYNIDVTWDDVTEFPDEDAPYTCDYYLKNDDEITNMISHRGFLPSSNSEHVRTNYFNSAYFNSRFPISADSYYINSGGEAVCAYCGETVDYGTPADNSHIYKVTYVAPSCTESGEKKYSCTHCSDSFVESVAPTGHYKGEAVEKITSKPTCTEEGFKHTINYCTVCNAEVFKSYSYVKKTGHSFKDSNKYCLNGCKTVNPVYKFNSTSIIKVTPKKNKAIVKWKKQKGISGYQLQYSTSKKFTKKTTKSVTVKKASTVKKTVKNLKSGKKYYFKIRTYKVINNKKVYSKWSAKQSKKIN